MTTATAVSPHTTPAAVEFALLQSWLASRSALQLPLHEIESRQQDRGREVQRLLLQAHLQARGDGDVGPALCLRQQDSELLYSHRRHQVTELPPIEAHITEYRCQSAVCPDCGKPHPAELPQEAQGHFGPELTALIAYLTVVCRMPRRVVRELLGQVLGIPLKSGQYSELAGRSQ